MSDGRRLSSCGSGPWRLGAGGPAHLRRNPMGGGDVAPTHADPEQKDGWIPYSHTPEYDYVAQYSSCTCIPFRQTMYAYKDSNDRSDSMEHLGHRRPKEEKVYNEVHSKHQLLSSNST